MIGSTMSVFAGRAAIAALALVFACANLTSPTAASETAPKKKSSGGFVIDISPGLILLPKVLQKQPKNPERTVCKAPGYISRGKCVYPEKPPVVVNCESPAVYSKKARRCIYPQKPPVVIVCVPPSVYSSKQRRCIYPEKPPVVVTCQAPAVYSSKSKSCYIPKKPTQTASCAWPTVRKGSTCVCASGYVSSGGKCIRPAKTEPSAPAVVVDVRHIQECLTNLGYDPGPIDGDEGRATRSAFRLYQEANGLAEQPETLRDEVTQAKLFSDCEAPAPINEEIVLASTDPIAPLSLPAAGKCLPQDLYDMLTAAYGDKPDLSACTPATAACLPKPLFYSEAKIAGLAAEGVEWCESCVKLGGWLPLANILQIEAAANITLCATPPALCYLPGRPVVQKQVEVRTIYKALPVSVGNEGDIAVVVGNENYDNGLTPNVYGEADADAVVQLLTEQLGYKKENIIDLRNAKLADFQRVFGSASNPNGELAARIKEDEPGDVIVYMSSHGLADGNEGTGYLLPIDADVERLSETAYPLQELYANLGEAGARTIMLMLEATFAKTVTDLVDPPNIPELEVLAMPEAPVPGLAVFTAADRDQRTLEDPEYGIGLFTRYLIAGLAGEADVAPIGNGDKRIDTVELYVYAADMVRTAARKSFGLEQKPILSKIDNLVVGKLASN
jgi:hypothetical protein